MDEQISSLSKLNDVHKRLLLKAGITKTSEIWLHAASDIARKLKISVEEVQSAFDAVCAEVAPIPKTLDSIPKENLAFTTGDATLDDRLAGGIPVGMITEISGGS